jgi:hypothetical protein
MKKYLYITATLVIMSTYACNSPSNNTDNGKTSIYTTTCGEEGVSEQGWVILDSNNVIQESGKAWWATDVSCSEKADLYYRVIVSSKNISSTTAPFDASVRALKQTLIKFQVYTTTAAGEALANTEMGINCPKGEWRDIDIALFAGPDFPTTEYGWFKFDNVANKVYTRSHDLAAYQGSETVTALPTEYPTDVDMVEYSLSSDTAETWLPTL